MGSRLLAAILGVSLFSAFAQSPPVSPANPPATQPIHSLAEMSPEELMTIEVTSASKKPEELNRAPAAIFVLTAEAIRRGGFTSVPDALRMVPGLYVAKVNSHWWTVSARGFSDYLNDKMLVLIDGRSVYTPQFGGVYWEVQNIPIDSIDRIEVIRGPGGTLWGDNTTNGVINIITRDSSDTQGAAVTTSAASADGALASVRYGGTAGDLAWRISGQSNYAEPGINPVTTSSAATNSGNTNAYDGWYLSQGAVRADDAISPRDHITFESGGYEGREQTVLPYFASPGAAQSELALSFVLRGGYVLSRWDHTISDKSSLSLLGYCDWTDRLDPVDEVRNTCHIDLQYNLRLAPRHSLTWGLNLDTTADKLYTSFMVQPMPAMQRIYSAGLFAEYDFDILPDRLRLSVGSKLEYNSYTQFQLQPQIRAAWTPDSRQTVWAAVSRAVRNPTRLPQTETFIFAELPGAIPTYLASAGNDAIRDEALRAYEAGYRFAPLRSVSIDAAIFYNHYDNLINLNLANPLSVAGPPVIHTDPQYAEIEIPWQNIGAGQTHGLEIYGTWRPLERWMVSAGVTELRGNSVNLNDSINLPVANTPRHQFNVQSRVNLRRNVEFDSSLYHYDGIAGYNFSGSVYQDVPTHNRVDAGLAVHARDGFTLSLWAHDIGAGPHWENHAPMFTTMGSEVRGQSIALNVTWQSIPKDAGTVEKANAYRPVRPALQTN